VAQVATAGLEATRVMAAPVVGAVTLEISALTTSRTPVNSPDRPQKLPQAILATQARLTAPAEALAAMEGTGPHPIPAAVKVGPAAQEERATPVMRGEQEILDQQEPPQRRVHLTVYL
jgi:hypothetical protein